MITNSKQKRWRFLYPLALVLGCLLLAATPAYAQGEVEISGVVTDNLGEPMIGVTVMAKGASTGAITDLDGNFRLKVSKNATIVFSFIGYKSVEKPAAALKNAKIVMQDDTQMLGEVVVVAYGSQKKETLTGAISQVKAAELTKSPVANMGQALTGRAAGVSTTQNSGAPGEDDVTIRIRGVGTLNDASPLVLVDGVERSFSQIDPSEVESMSILKDAASTAVFGIRGANGVIIITTKKGKEGPAKVSFSANWALQQPVRVPNSADAVTTAKMYDEAIMNDDPTAGPYFGEAAYEKYANGSDPLAYPNINWKEYLLKNIAFQQRYNLSVSGGTPNTKYYVSLSFLDQDGVMEDVASDVDGLIYDHNNKYQRVNLRSNIDVDLTSTTKLGIQLGGIIGKKNAPKDTFTQLLQASSNGSPYIYDHKFVHNKYTSFGGSPLGDLLKDVRETSNNTINASITFNQKLDFITKGLSFRALASYDSQYIHTLTKGEQLSTYYLIDAQDEAGNPIKALELYSLNEGAIKVPSESWDRRQSMHAEAALEYKREFGGHNVNALFLGTLDKKWWKYSESSAFKQYITVPVSYMGLVGRVAYDYQSRYLVEFNVGYNGSENFAEGKRFAWFPAVSVGWNLAEEKFFKNAIDPKWISRLKLRASYGLTGNDNTDGRRFMYLTGEYTSGGGAYLGSSVQQLHPGYLEGKQGNTAVTWETASKQNYGIDLGMFDGRLSLTAEYFHDDRKDILATRATEPGHLAISGQDVYNIGRVKNQGCEIYVRWSDELENGLGYFVSGNYSFARNEIIENGEIQDPDNPHLWRAGHSVGVEWGYRFAGFYNTEEELAEGPHLGTPSLGEARYVDINRDGVLDTNDMVPMGYAEVPEINYGFSLGASYKGFAVSCLFQGAAHSTKLLDGVFRRPFYANQGMPSFVVGERWTPETAETAVRPKLTTRYNSMSYENSTLWTRSGDYLKLRNVELSYTFTADQLKKIFGIPLNSLRVYVTGQNLFTWDKLKYVDPEAKTTDQFKYPQLRIYNLGLSLNF